MGKLTYEKIINYKKIKDINNLITEKQKLQIEKIINEYDTNSIKNRLDSIRQFILCGVDDHWLGRIKIIRNKLKTDVISDYSCKIRYGNMWEEKQNELKNKIKTTFDTLKDKFGDEVAKEKWEELRLKRRTYGKKIMVEKYGDIEGLKRWESALKSKVKTMAERKKIKPYRNGRTLVEYQERYGVKSGYQKWIERNNKQKYRFSIQYYIDTYGDNYVEEWIKYTNSMSKTSLKSYIDRYGNEMGVIKYNEYVYKIVENLKVRPNYSRISQELFSTLLKYIGNTDNIYFAEHGGEFIFYPNSNDDIFGKLKLIQVDFKMGNKIIEFDGDYWHSKQEQMEKDKIREEYLTGKGYFIKRVKESEYRANKEYIINECLNFLKNK
jgi:hypothetical protein